MVNVVLWLSNKSCSSELALTLAQNDIRIIEDGFSNVDSFIDCFDNLEIVKDVLVVSYTLIQNVDSKKLFEHIRKINPNIRIVIIFPGYRNQYVTEQLDEYASEYKIDSIFAGSRLDIKYFIDVIKKEYNLNDIIGNK